MNSIKNRPPAPLDAPDAPWDPLADKKPACAAPSGKKGGPSDGFSPLDEGCDPHFSNFDGFTPYFDDEETIP